jgi:hypothetical protein
VDRTPQIKIGGERLSIPNLSHLLSVHGSEYILEMQAILAEKKGAWPLEQQLVLGFAIPTDICDKKILL